MMIRNESAGPIGVALAAVLCLPITASAQAPENPAAQGGASAAREVAEADKSPGAALPSGDEGTWTLASEQDGARLIGRLGWANESQSALVGLEASATLDPKATEVEPLNLDGVGSGDSSLIASLSFSGSWLRTERNGMPRSMLPTCREINEALEDQIRASRGTGDCCSPKLLAGETCTMERLQSVGGAWAVEARQAEAAAVAAGCAALLELDADRALQGLPGGLPEGVRRFGTTGDCTRETLQAQVDAERTARQEASDKLDREIAELDADGERLLDRLARLEAQFAGASNEEQRSRIARERLDVQTALSELPAKIAKRKAAREELLPPLLVDLPAWLAKHQKKPLATICERYSNPDRSAQLELSGFAVECDTVRAAAALAGVQNDRLRGKLRRQLYANLPVAVWYATLKGGAINSAFKFVDPAVVASLATFGEIAGKVQEETEQDTIVGLQGSVQRGNNFLRLGVDRRDRNSGGTPGEICAPLAVGGPLRCADVTFGAPKRKDERVGSLEYRRFLTGSLGLSARLFYIDEGIRLGKLVEHEWESHAVFFFLPHKEKGLNGGIDISYDTFTDDPRARVFIGQSFNIWN